MHRALYLTHPEVVLDKTVPADRWGLSDLGRERITRFAERDLLPGPIRIFSSPERKTAETVDIIATHLDAADVCFDDRLRENIRPSAGLLSPADLEARLQALYDTPESGSGDWEPAAETEKRVVAAVQAAQTSVEDGVLLFVGHGTAGTLLKCALGGRPATRADDQRLMAHPGGGNLFVFDLAEWQLLCEWTAIEQWKGFGS